MTRCCALQRRSGKALSPLGCYCASSAATPGDDLLAFVGVLDDKLAAIARTAAVPDYLVRETCLLHRKPDTSGAFW